MMPSWDEQDVYGMKARNVTYVETAPCKSVARLRKLETTLLWEDRQ